MDNRRGPKGRARGAETACVLRPNRV